MEGLKRNKKYFIEDRGEADEETAQKIDIGLSDFMAKRTSDFSLEKTELEKKDVSWLIKEIGQIAEFYDADPYDYKPEHMHVIKENEWQKLQKSSDTEIDMGFGTTGVVTGEDILRNRLDRLDAIILLAHEFFHAYSLNKISLVSEEDGVRLIDNYRVGIRITHGHQKKEIKKSSLRYDRFRGLNEGLTQELTRLFYSRIIRKSSYLKELVENFDKSQQSEAGEWEFPETLKKSYDWLIHLFNDLCQEIRNKLPEKYKNISEIKDEFFKIYFTGNIVDLKPLFDIIGSGCFSELSDIGSADSLDDLNKVKKFREKYGFTEDNDLNKMIKNRQLK